MMTYFGSIDIDKFLRKFAFFGSDTPQITGVLVEGNHREMRRLLNVDLIVDVEFGQ
jgi:hypothetical protein